MDPEPVIGSQNQSGSSSSLSSLSHLDDAAETQEVEKDKISQNASMYRKSEKQVLLPAQHQSILVEKYQSAVYESQQTNKRTDFILQRPVEQKSVTFQSKTSLIKPTLISMKMDDSVKEENDRNVNTNGFHGNDVEESKVGNGVHEKSGSVVITELVTNIYTHTAPQNSRSHVTNLEMLRDNTHALVNGNHAFLATGDVYQPETTSTNQQATPPAPPSSPPPPVSFIPKQNHLAQPVEYKISKPTQNVPQILGYGNKTSVVAPLPNSQQSPPPSNGPTFQHANDTREHVISQSTPPAPQLGIGNQQAIVPPPPPPPPPPEAGKQPVRNPVSDEIKRKSASLPARLVIQER